MTASARGGVDSVEHAWLADRASIEALAASGAFLVPTPVVTDVNRDLPGLTPIQRERQDTGEVGVTSDLVWREVVLLHDHGASAMAAIQAATSAAARLLGLDAEIGTVEPGKRADLVLVDGDPLADLRRLAAPRFVMQGGLVVSRA